MGSLAHAPYVQDRVCWASYLIQPKRLFFLIFYRIWQIWGLSWHCCGLDNTGKPILLITIYCEKLLLWPIHMRLETRLAEANGTSRTFRRGMLWLIWRAMNHLSSHSRACKLPFLCTRNCHGGDDLFLFNRIDAFRVWASNKSIDIEVDELSKTWKCGRRSSSR